MDWPCTSFAKSGMISSFLYHCSTQIKWICPTAPTRPVSVFGGFPSTACKLCVIYLFFLAQGCCQILLGSLSVLILNTYALLCSFWICRVWCCWSFRGCSWWCCGAGCLSSTCCKFVVNWTCWQYASQVLFFFHFLVCWLVIFGCLFIYFIPSYQANTTNEIAHISFAVVSWACFLICSIHLMKLLDFYKRACMLPQI